MTNISHFPDKEGEDYRETFKNGVTMRAFELILSADDISKLKLAAKGLGGQDHYDLYERGFVNYVETKEESPNNETLVWLTDAGLAVFNLLQLAGMIEK